MIRKEAWSFYRTISGVRLGWELEEPEEPTGLARTAPSMLGPSRKGAEGRGVVDFYMGGRRCVATRKKLGHGLITVLEMAWLWH